jgi:hypothetical protein
MRSGRRRLPVTPPDPSLHLASRHRGLGEWHIVGDAGEPAFENGWDSLVYVDLTSVVATEPMRFMRDDYGLIHIHGEADHGAGSWAGGTIFTLPAGFRPAYRTVFLVAADTTFGVKEARLDVYADGSVVLQPDVTEVYVSDRRFRKA